MIRKGVILAGGSGKPLFGDTRGTEAAVANQRQADDRPFTPLMQAGIEAQHAPA